MKSPDGSRTFKTDRNFQVIWDGSVVKYTASIPEIDSFSEGHFYWDREAKKVAVVILSTRGVIQRGTVSVENGVLTVQGTMVFPDRTFDYKNTFELSPDGKMIDRWFQNAFGPWQPGHVVEFMREKSRIMNWKTKRPTIGRYHLMTRILAYLTVLIIFIGAGAGALRPGAGQGRPGFCHVPSMGLPGIHRGHPGQQHPPMGRSVRGLPDLRGPGGPGEDRIPAQGQECHLRAPDFERLGPVLSLCATKAFAAAKVEEMTAGKIGTLVWLDPETIILGPPKEYDLKKGSAAAVAPVTFINTGQAENEPIDAYWGPIYKRCGLELKKIFPVETFVDCKKVRAWLNCGMFSVRPERGLFREWAKILDEFINDQEYQRTAITDGIHRTFLHQAVISDAHRFETGAPGNSHASQGLQLPLVLS